MRWLTVIGTDAWIALGLLEALFYGADGDRLGVVAATPLVAAGVRGRPGSAPSACAATVPFGGLPWGRLAFGLVDTPVVRYGRLGGPLWSSFVVVLAVALVVDVVERRAALLRRPRSAPWQRARPGAGERSLLPVGLGRARRRRDRRGRPGQRARGGDGPVRRAARRARTTTPRPPRTSPRRWRPASAPRPDVVIWPENSTDIDPFTRPSPRTTRSTAAVQGHRRADPRRRRRRRARTPTTSRTWASSGTRRPGRGSSTSSGTSVPFGEYIPFRALLTQLIGRLKQIPRDFAPRRPGRRAGPRPVQIGDVMCFEVAYDGLVRDVIDGGGQLLVVQTNNATYTGTGQLEQQFAISRYRAIESGRQVVVAATNGISGIIAAGRRRCWRRPSRRPARCSKSR